MKVKELIEELKKVNPELKVYCQYYLNDDVEMFEPTWVSEYSDSKVSEHFVQIKE